MSFFNVGKQTFISPVPLVSVYHCNVLQSHQGSMTSIAICYQLSWLLIYQCWSANDFGYTICICYPNMFEVYSEQPFAAKLEISLIDNRNNKGPRRDPCGTPDEISTNGDSFSITKHSWFIFFISACIVIGVGSSPTGVGALFAKFCLAYICWHPIWQNKVKQIIEFPMS